MNRAALIAGMSLLLAGCITLSGCGAKQRRYFSAEELCGDATKPDFVLGRDFRDGGIYYGYNCERFK